MNKAIRAAARREFWAIEPHWLRAALDADSSAADAPRKLPRVGGQVAVLPMHGPITQRESYFSRYFGGCSCEGFGAAYAKAVNSADVKAVVFDVSSPGGTVSGIPELADLVHQGTMIKPTYAVANSLAASAAYWLAYQVGKGHFLITPSGDAGSIGVFCLHVDESKLIENEGIKVTFVSTPQYKTEGNPYEPLSDDTKEFWQTQIDATYAMFVAHVARGRGVPTSHVRKHFGEGRCFHAQQAKDMGLCDRVATLSQVLGELTASSGSAAGSSASAFADIGYFVNAARDARLTDELCEAWESGNVEPWSPENRRKLNLARLAKWESEVGRPAPRPDDPAAIAAMKAQIDRDLRHIAQVRSRSTAPRKTIAERRRQLDAIESGMARDAFMRELEGAA